MTIPSRGLVLAGRDASPSTSAAALAAGSSAPWASEAYANQWNLANGKQGIRLDALGGDYTGAGVRVAVIDDGFDYRHGELSSRYRTDLDWDALGNDADALAQGTDNHGTAVMSVIGAAVGNNGMRGVASGADLVGVRIGFESAWNATAIVKAIAYAASQADVVNMSWGNHGTFGGSYRQGNSAMQSAFLTGVDKGRGGLGTVFVASAGNERKTGLDTNTTSMKADPNLIVVAATDSSGNVASFSTPGASILVAAPGVSVLAADRLGAAGYVAGDFALTSGTSFAAPTVSGVVALMLQANPNLGYRDVQEILALTATRTATNTVWGVNGSTTWNGGGMHVSHDLGFGLVNAEAAVRLAEMWALRQTAANDVAVSVTQGAAVALRDNGSASSTITVPGTDRLDHVETVQVTLNISHARPSDLVVTLTSPEGTTVTLLNRPANGTSSSGIVFDMSATAFRGEQENGTWTLTVTDRATGVGGTLNGWSLNLLGDKPTADTLYVYTDEYGMMWTPDRAVLRDGDGGTDTLMLAALTGNAVIDLSGGPGSIAGASFAVDAASRLERVILGSGNDRVIGAAGDELLIGNRGADTLMGGAGLDRLEGGAGNDSLLGGQGADELWGGLGADVFGYATAQEGGDRLRDFSLAQGDRIDPRALLLSLGWTGTVQEALAAGRFALNTVTGGRELAVQAYGQWVGLVVIEGLSIAATLGQLFDIGNVTETSAVFTFVDSDSGTWGTGASWGRQGTHYQLFDASRAMKALSLDLATGLLMANGKRAASSGIVVDVVRGGAGNDTISGSALADYLQGGAGGDSLSGRDGDDTLMGEAGNDRLDGGAGHDGLEGAEGIDTLAGGDGADRLQGGAGADSLTGGAGHDVLDGGADNDRMLGEDGEDTLLGGAGHDHLAGGTGHDSLEGGEGNDTLDASTGNDLLAAGSGHDSLSGGEGDDLLRGDEGNDVLMAGAGHDTLDGGADADRLSGEAGQDSLSGGTGNDSLDGGTGNDTLMGGAGNDTLSGGDDADRLAGDAGVDLLTGGKGADSFVLDAEGGDIILDWSAAEGDSLDLSRLGDSPVLSWKQGASGAVLWATTGASPVALVTLAGKIAADTQLLSGTSVDHVYAFTDGMLAGQKFTLVDATGTDRIDLSRLGAGVTFDLNAGKGGLIAGGSLTLTTSVIENLTGTQFADVLTGNAASNLVVGGSGADSLSGGSGNDTLEGGEGLDRLSGGLGADVFRLALGEADRIEDFKTTEGDRLDLAGVLAGMGLSLTAAVGAGRLKLVQEGQGSTLLVDLAGNGTLAALAWLAGVSGATAVANLVSGARTAALPMLVSTGTVSVVLPETDGTISWNALAAANWTTMGGTLMGSGTGYDLSQVAGAAVVTMGTAIGTLKGATLGFLGDVTDLRTGDFADKITTGAGHDRIWSGAGNDTLTGGAGNNVLFADAGEDSIRAGTGQDSLYGGLGNDKLYAEDGNDLLFGEAGNDLLDGGSGQDLLTGAEGRDTLMGQAGQDTLSGGAENDSLDGGADNDLLNGGAGQDTLLGGTGHDTLQGDAGADRLTGGAGADRFVFDLAEGLDIVTDFKASEGDRLDLSLVVDDFGYASTQEAWADGALRALVSGKSTLVQIEGPNGAWISLAVLETVATATLAPDWLG